jgi:Na+-transporting methylmalonyl-CoA/oxaloacetate decarboxylase gamma subunit
MVVVFIVLAILMYLIMGMERFFRGGELAVEEVAVDMPVEAATAIKEPIVVGRDEPKPGDTGEVAAITVAIASHLRGKSKKLGNRININGVLYDVDVADLHAHPISVVVNGERFRTSLNEEGLPVSEEVTPKLGERAKYAKQGAGWRSAYSPLQGDYWCRRGWTGRRAGNERE